MKFKKGDRVRPLVAIGNIPKGVLCLVISVDRFHHKVGIYFPQYKTSIFEEDDITYLVVIDYKTGSTNINLKNMEYGFGLQLPIYLYLSSKMELKNVKVVGFYLQKLFNTTLDNSKDYDTAKENNLRLEGYSIDEENILSKFDTTYNDSKLIKGMKTTSKGFSSYSKVLSEEEINDMLDNTDKLIDKAIDNILEADFEINPKVINGENVSCSFCEYRDICYLREKDKVYINKDGEDNGD